MVLAVLSNFSSHQSWKVIQEALLKVHYQTTVILLSIILKHLFIQLDYLTIHTSTGWLGSTFYSRLLIDFYLRLSMMGESLISNATYYQYAPTYIYLSLPCQLTLMSNMTPKL